MINAVVGSGTLLTFPTLLALGYPAVTANVSNNIGLVFGGVTATWGYRRELRGQRGRLLRLAPLSLVGAVPGAGLLLGRGCPSAGPRAGCAARPVRGDRAGPHSGLRRAGPP